jgi:hypothetical protein
MVEREPVTDAQAALRHDGLGAAVRTVPAPGVTPGIVVGESGIGETVPAGSTVALQVAETPQWRSVTSFTGGASAPFTIIGTRWRLVYQMGYQGMCTWILFCSGPNAHVNALSPGAGAVAVAGGNFSLNDGTGQTQTFTSGPGRYQVWVTPGGDRARWAVTIEDWY